MQPAMRRENFTFAHRFRHRPQGDKQQEGDPERVRRGHQITGCCAAQATGETEHGDHQRRQQQQREHQGMTHGVTPFSAVRLLTSSVPWVRQILRASNAITITAKWHPWRCQSPPVPVRAVPATPAPDASRFPSGSSQTPDAGCCAG